MAACLQDFCIQQLFYYLFAEKECLFTAEELFCPINSIEDFINLFRSATNLRNYEYDISMDVPDHIRAMLKKKQENIQKRTGGKRKRGTIFMPHSLKKDHSFRELIRSALSTLKNINIKKIKNQMIDLVRRERAPVSLVDFPVTGPDVKYIVVTLFE